MQDPLLELIPGDVAKRTKNTIRIKNLQQNLDHVKKEFIGKPLICHELVKLIVLLRRDIDVEQNTAVFFKLLKKYHNVILNNFDTRWLVSICDTIVDHGEAVDKAAAMCVVITVNNLNVHESLLNCTTSGALNSDKLRTAKNKTPTWDGMISMDLKRGDTLINMQNRMNKVVSSSSVVNSIWIEIKKRLRDIPELPINRLCAVNQITDNKVFFI